MKQPTPKDIWITKNLPHFGNKQQDTLYREHVLKQTVNAIKTCLFGWVYKDTIIQNGITTLNGEEK